MPTITTRALRGSSIVAIAAVGVLGLAGCSGGGDEEPTTSASSGAEESSEASTEPTTSEAPEETEAAADGTLCTAEQVTTLSAAAGVTVPEAALAQATAEFQPASVIGELPTTCVLTFSSEVGTGSYAVLPGGAATLTTVAAQATAAGGQITEAGGTLTGTVEGLTVAGVPFTSLTQETAGFENVADLVVVVSTGAMG